ncbi:SMP-30/gluconolactonase/LRE family protein [Nonomuraea diastatica]|uniref:SMP-30/gluconolactonase/LRE family protein n=1 Tax=Nonomuraea diastatica TaxID=1848329 RepID=A0A4V2YES8_9ACTN|nr:SMP-30/gluconolactonase/LRE family protein [Nonomuraea diastatica]TDD20437.1 SMP-30/gluconolactonase/LRE family protein [Nonomuraea diastatica]
MIAGLMLDARATVAESPVWDPERQRLWWADIPAGRVHLFSPATGEDMSFEAGEAVGAVAVRRDGGLLLATATGIIGCAADGSARTVLHEVDTDPPGGRFNDGKADPWGRFWAGTLLTGIRGAGALYRLDPDGTLHTMLTGVSVSNGLGWSPDGRTFYYADSPTGGVDTFDHDPETGALTNRRRLIDIDRGRPDGLTTDAEGCLWVALWEGGAVQRFTPEGRLVKTIEIPARKVTSCSFGGLDLDTLYVTTARVGLSEAELREQPHAGGIFAIAAGTRGQPSGAYA